MTLKGLFFYIVYRPEAPLIQFISFLKRCCQSSPGSTISDHLRVLLYSLGDPQVMVLNISHGPSLHTAADVDDLPEPAPLPSESGPGVE